MQLVIDIDEEDYNFIKEVDESNYSVTTNLYKAVYEGIILPKGHGRIADMDEAIKCIKDCEGEDAIWAIALIDWACGKRTILEADKGSEV